MRVINYLNNRYVTGADLARMIGVSRERVRQMRESGRIISAIDEFRWKAYYRLPVSVIRDKGRPTERVETFDVEEGNGG